MASSKGAEPKLRTNQLPASSKKKAGTSAAAKNKQKAAKNLVKMETLANPDYGQTINPISRLIQIQQAKKEKEPVYTLIEERGLPRKREFVMKVSDSCDDNLNIMPPPVIVMHYYARVAVLPPLKAKF